MSYASFSLKNFNYDYDLLLYTETRRHRVFLTMTMTMTMTFDGCFLCWPNHPLPPPSKGGELVTL